MTNKLTKEQEKRFVLSKNIDCPWCIAKSGEDCWIEVPRNERLRDIAEQSGEIHLSRVIEKLNND